MSTPNPTHIDVIARAFADAADDGCFDNPPCCEKPPCSDTCDGDLTDLDEWRSGEEDREHWTKLAHASVSKLTDAGYSIVPNPQRGEPLEAPELRRTADSLERIAHWQWPDDRDECPFTAKGLRNHADALDEWEPVIAAAAEGEKP